MERRTAILSGVSLLVSAVIAGCSGDDEDEEPEVTGGEQYREAENRSEYLTVDRDVLLTENDTAVVEIHLTNTAETPRNATVRLQMRDTDGEPTGAEYSQTEGPIESGEQAQLRFDIDETAEDVGGYRIEITDEAA